MLSDVSSLSSLSDSDSDEYVAPRSSRTGEKKPRGRAWQLKQVLKAYRTVQLPTISLYEDILNGKVDLDPEYQRDIVWTDAKQSGLIDSIMRNFYIPPVIFAHHMSDDGEERRTCIDGKQRLTSIQRFMDGQIPYKDPKSNLKLWYKLQPGNTGRLLPEQYRKQFAKKQIVCIEYSDISDDNEREIFQRVQLGVALTPAERMQAIASPWSQLVREVLGVMAEYKMAEHMDWLSTRGRDFHGVAASIYLLEKQPSKKYVYPSVSTIEAWLRRVTPPTKLFKERVLDAFAVFRQLVLVKKYSNIFQATSRISPIEFVMCVVTIDTYMKTHTLTQLAAGIRRMREDVRKEHVDIRANTKVITTMFKFIRERWPTNLKPEDSKEKPALISCRTNPVSKPREKGKRKRGDDSSDLESEASSEDEKPPVILQTSKAVKAATPMEVDQPQAVMPDSRDRLSGLRAMKDKVAAKLEVTTPNLKDADDFAILEAAQRIINRNAAGSPQQYQWPNQQGSPAMPPPAVQNNTRAPLIQSPSIPSAPNHNGNPQRASYDPGNHKPQSRRGSHSSPRLPPVSPRAHNFNNNPYGPPRGPNSPDYGWSGRSPNDTRGRDNRDTRPSNSGPSPKIGYHTSSDRRRL